MEAQEERKKAEKTSVSCADNSAPVRAKRDRRKEAERIKLYQFKPGIGKSGGRPKHDLAADIARAIFENDAEAIYAAYAKMLSKGSPYGFLVLSDWAYAKMKETHQVNVSPSKDVPTDDLAAQIKRLGGQLGFEESFAGGSVKTGASVPGVDESSEERG